jgi:hypothetical protein
VQAFVKTLLLYALVGPLVGLLSLAPIGVVVTAWDVISHWLASIDWQALSISCENQTPSHLDPRCFEQRTEPFHLDLNFHISWQGISFVVVSAYVIGFLPASFAGVLVAQGRLLAGNAFRVWHVLVLGCVVGVIFTSIVGADQYLHDARFFQGCALLVYVCVVATVLCWLVARRWWPQTDFSD